MVMTRRKAQETHTPLKAGLPDKRSDRGLADDEDVVPYAGGKPAGKTWAESDGTGDRNSFLGLSGNLGKLVSVVGASVLMVICPAFAIATWFTLTQMDGSIVNFIEYIRAGGLEAARAAWPTPSLRAWGFIAAFGVLQAALQLFVPGKTHYGPVTPKGNTPVYKANGVQRYFVTLFLFAAGTACGAFRPAEVYDLFGEILSGLNTFSILFCVLLYVKGHLAPSSTDSGSTGSLVFDYYWGMELYPRFGKHFDIKTWTNCGMGMMGWAVLPLCWAAKQYELHGYVSNSMLVSVLLQQVYVFKFFLWETGYWGSMDIAHDRAGYYICWGCLYWVPAIYCSPALYLVTHPQQLPTVLAALILIAGLACIYINWDADRQRQEFRATNGKAPVWGKEPVIIHASYGTKDGKTKSSILLASGWWGISRHFHYVPEILGAFLWTCPCMFSHYLPYFYVTFLTILLTDRAYRDDQRCSSKYGTYWSQYCKTVPYKMVPYVF